MNVPQPGMTRGQQMINLPSTSLQQQFGGTPSQFTTNQFSSSRPAPNQAAYHAYHATSQTSLVQPQPNNQYGGTPSQVTTNQFSSHPAPTTKPAFHAPTNPAYCATSQVATNPATSQVPANPEVVRQPVMMQPYKQYGGPLSEIPTGHLSQILSSHPSVNQIPAYLDNRAPSNVSNPAYDSNTSLRGRTLHNTPEPGSPAPSQLTIYSTDHAPSQITTYDGDMRVWDLPLQVCSLVCMQSDVTIIIVLCSGIIEG